MYLPIKGKIVYITFLLLLSAIGPTRSQDRLSMILESEKLINKGDTAQSITNYKKILEHYPQSFSATKRLAEIYYYQKDYYHAILYTNIALDITDNFLARQDELLAKNKQTMTSSERVESHQKTDQYLKDKADAHHLKGLIRLKQFRHADAIEELDMAIKVDSGNHSLYLDKATILIEKGVMTQARQYLHLATKDPLLRGKALFSFANSFYKEKRLDSALFYYNEVIKSNPLYKLAYQYKGLVLTEMQRYQQAQHAFTQFIQLDSTSEEIFFRRAVLYNELGEMTKALNDWDKVLTLNPENQEALRNRGLTYFQLGEYMEAIADFDKALEQAPGQSFTRINRGYSYYLLNQPDKALTDLNKGIEQMPRYYLGRYFRALVYLQKRKKKEACRDLKRAIELGMKEADIDRILIKKCL
ncbi:tetratricopeptide repeat protein [Fulvivirga sp. M361]|uniref:tetratricopeptide repeat protein n=1 Tax=Fulvivirga sp. M361 TaxID=2594266 RepID=UPI00117A738B|nr:tetratricopeptide repeat protein [Fulvivirga sp. M361]TRX52404.1 tetratricopeptide repeat protein [Fulvivirga sp. M361]